MKGEGPDDPDFTVPFGKSRVAREGKDVTIVGYSKMVQLALAAATQLAEAGIDCEVIDLRSIRPLDMDPVYESVRKTHRAIVMQEQWKPFGAAGEIVASINEEVFDELDAPVLRVTGEDVPMPYARNLELLAVPHEEDVIAAVHKVMYR
jgi:pyruvate dehydrogenase E1 component beta subunit